MIRDDHRDTIPAGVPAFCGGQLLPPPDLPEDAEAISVLLRKLLDAQVSERRSRALEHAQGWERMDALTAAVTALAGEVCLLRSEVAALRGRIDALACQSPPPCPVRTAP
jgi:hypothetical protein